MVLTWISRKGGRRVNEDAVANARKNGIVCVVVADGLGGHNGGQTASKITVDTIIDSFKSAPGFSKDSLLSYIKKAKDKVVEKAMEDPDLLYMSSTAVILLIKGRRAIWANVGDSRLYMLYNGKIQYVTEDHSVAFLDFARGDIEYDEIRKSENQNKLTSAIGVAIDGVNISDEMRINSNVSFLLCTDGWWEYVDEDAIEMTASTARNAKDWLENMVKIREKKAPQNSDNYTATVVTI